MGKDIPDERFEKIVPNSPDENIYGPDNPGPAVNEPWWVRGYRKI